MAGHVPPAVANLAPTGRLAPETMMGLSIGLPLRNREALTNLLQELCNPASSSFRHFITVGEFTKRFGPTAEDYQKVVDFAQSRGLTVETKHPNRMLVEATGRAAEVEAAFEVKLQEFRHPTENRTFFAPDREPSVAMDLPILHVGGMDNYMAPRPLSHVKPAGGASPASGSGPGGNYAGKDFRAAYAPATTLTGAGQSVGLLEFGGYYASDIRQYERNFSLPNVPLDNVVLDGISNITVNADGGEEPLDIEMAISMAPSTFMVTRWL
jgi:subtilase family serine protease